MKIFSFFLALCLCTNLILVSQGIATEAKKENKKVSIRIPKNAPRMKVLGAEFVLIKNGTLPDKVKRMHDRWEEIMQSHDKSIFLGNKIPLPNLHRKQWQNMISINKKNPNPLKTLRNVNGFFNSISSRKDKDFYGKNEHWATPEEFISNRTGDCEDYAITKYFALQHFKWPVKNLWIVFLQDNVNVGGHAVLVAKTGNKTYVLDNLSKPVYLLIPAKQYEKQVTPFAMANHQGLWLRVRDKKDTDVSDKNTGTL